MSAPTFEVLSTSHLQHISYRMHFHILSPYLLSEALSSSLFHFLALSSFHIRLCSSEPLCITFPYTHKHIMHPMRSTFPHYIFLALFAVGPSLHGYFAFVHHFAVVFIASAALCGVPLSGSRAGLVFVVFIENVSTPALICIHDKFFPLVFTFLLALNCTSLHIRAKP
jgi:hypothetical protein